MTDAERAVVEAAEHLVLHEGDTWEVQRAAKSALRAAVAALKESRT